MLRTTHSCQSRIGAPQSPRELKAKPGFFTTGKMTKKSGLWQNRAQTAPRNGTRTILSVVKAFFHRNSVLHFPVSQAWRGFAFLAPRADIMRNLIACALTG